MTMPARPGRSLLLSKTVVCFVDQRQLSFTAIFSLTPILKEHSLESR